MDLITPPVVGADLLVPLSTGELVRYANLDHAASAPCLCLVRDAVNELLPWYASVHRGAGFASQVSSRVYYESARQVLREFVGAPAAAAVVFTRNTTDALNLLARALPPGTSVVTFDTEHHAAMLPFTAARLRTPRSAAETVGALDGALAKAPRGPHLVVLTGASNVTGELWPIAELAAVARRHGTRVALDAAQLAPHRRLAAEAWQVDYVVLSGHKLYAPFGAGALVGPADWLQAAPPYLIGSGATARVTQEAGGLVVSWTDVPDRHEAGSPNIVGVHALTAACRGITAHRGEVEEHEADLLYRLLRRPRAALLALLCQMVLLPLVCLGLIALLGVDGLHAVGLMLLVASPGGSLANLFSHLADGDGALNVTLTAANSVLAIVTMPLVVAASIAGSSASTPPSASTRSGSCRWF